MILNLLKTLLHRIIIVNLFIFTLFLINTAQAAGKMPIIIDSDVSTDDAIAILYLLNNDKVDVKAIIVDRNAASFAKTASSHIAYLLTLANKPLIPVYLGANKPTKKDHDYPVFFKQQVDQSYQDNTLKPTVLINQKQLANIILSQPQSIKILSLGSLTNIAELFATYPKVKNKISNITIMGGAIHVPGNIHDLDTTSHNLSSEWNIFVDPLAFQTVLASMIPIVLVPLDITNNSLVTLRFLDNLHKQANNPRAQFVYALLSNNIQWIKANEYDFWDPLAAFVIANPEQVRTSKIKITTIMTPGNHFGQTIESSSGYSVDIVTKVNENALEKALLNSLI